MRPTIWRSIAAVSALLALLATAAMLDAARHPRYGGELRVEMRARLRTLDPADSPEDPAALAAQRLWLPAVFETLVRLDDHGQPQPWLATSWVHDAARKSWIFTARKDVKFHDGTPWLPAGGSVVFPDDRPVEQILRELAGARNAITMRTADGTLLGTGPYRIAKWDAGSSATLVAHDQYWGGRPYLDSISIQMARSLADQANDFQINKTEVAEIPLRDLRAAKQRGTLTSETPPMETLALVFENGRVPPNVRRALALSIDRAAIHSVLLQNQGEISGALLPRWLSGYAFLFPIERDVAKARQIAPSTAPLSFAYDRDDSMIRPIGERIAVNAGEAGITLRAGSGPADVRLLRLPITTGDPWLALQDLASVLKLSPPATTASPYEAEKGDPRQHRRHPIVSFAARVAAAVAGAQLAALRGNLARSRGRSVTFRTKLLFISSFTMAGAVALVTGAVSISTRRAFERIDTERREALLSQFRAELNGQSADIARRMDALAKSPGVQQIAAGAAEYDRAQTEAAVASLDFLDVVQSDLTIISSAHWPARFGYKNDWQIAPDDWRSADVFLARIPTPEGSATGLITVRPVSGGRALAVGGRRLTPEVLKSLGIAPGMRALLWVPPGEVIDAQERGNDPNKLNALIQDVRAKNGQASGVVQWTPDRASSEGFVAFPLTRAGTLAGVLLAGTSLGEQMALERSILWTGVAVAASGIVIGILLGWWTTERITKPVERLAAGARAVAGGDLSARVEVLSHDEIGELARAFNRMTEQLLEQRERAIQAERVAAWRELARRLAHELKNPLFPLQITIENLQRARGSNEFDEVFAESTSTLLAELGNLKTIVGRFSDFAKMPTPQFETVDVNEVVRSVMKLYDARFQANGRPKIEPVLELGGEGVRISADPEQLRRAFGNLVLNAMDAMPEGGTLRVRTTRHDDGVRIEISDTGQGLTEEECARLFTPYYTTKQHGTGLGLAIVQSVVSDHQGKIAVVSQPGRGATFVIDLPENHLREAAS